MPAKDPLEMSGLEPDNIAAVVESKKKKPVSELDKAKEARLSQKEAISQWSGGSICHSHTTAAPN